jgi:hypothetical protein
MKESWVIGVFSAGCPVCRELAQEIRRTVCTCCEVWVLNAPGPWVARRIVPSCGTSIGPPLPLRNFFTPYVI